MSKKIVLVIALVFGLIGGAAGMYFYLSVGGGKGAGGAAVDGASVEGGKKILYWQAPMNPSYISEKPGKSPMGMDLIPVYEGAQQAEPGSVMIDPVTVQNIGVRTQRVKRIKLEKVVRTIGRVDYDEKRVYHIHTKIDGWVEKLYFDFTGEKVKKGDILIGFYSPKLISAQEEFLLARKLAPSMRAVERGSLVELSRRRLELWDVPAHQIKEIEETGKIKRTLHIHSPVTGIIVEKPVMEGMYVKPGANLYTIADISKVWVYAEVYEYEMPWIKVGQTALVTLASYPGEVFRGKVSFIFPFLDEKTRTVRVRIALKNPGFKLKPDMYADVSLKSVVGKKTLAVPKEAVLLSGERTIVILSRGEGKFMPRQVTLGVETGDYYEVVDGLKEGDLVVTSAQFLIDSESRLKEAISKMLEVKKKAGVTGEKQDKKMGMEGMKGMKMDGVAAMGDKKPVPKPRDRKDPSLDMMNYPAEHRAPTMEHGMDMKVLTDGPEQKTDMEGMKMDGPGKMDMNKMDMKMDGGQMK